MEIHQLKNHLQKWSLNALEKLQNNIKGTRDSQAISPKNHSKQEGKIF